MPDMDFDSDAMLAFFGQMGKGVDELKTKIVSLNEASRAMKKIRPSSDIHAARCAAWKARSLI
jgi:hypothetical protein